MGVTTIRGTTVHITDTPDTTVHTTDTTVHITDIPDTGDTAEAPGFPGGYEFGGIVFVTVFDNRSGLRINLKAPGLYFRGL